MEALQTPGSHDPTMALQLQELVDVVSSEDEEVFTTHPFPLFVYPTSHVHLQALPVTAIELETYVQVVSWIPPTPTALLYTPSPEGSVPEQAEEVVVFDAGLVVTLVPSAFLQLQVPPHA